MAAFLADSTTITGRHLRWLLRQPWYIAITLIQPVVWLVLFGALFQRVVDIPGFSARSYNDYLVPGIVAMSALFSAGWCGMGFIDDINRGVMDRMLVTPVSRGAIMTARVAYQSVVTLAQSWIIVGLAAALGARPDPLGAVVVTVASALLSAGVASLSNALALVVRQEESLIGAVQFVALPATFVSSSFMHRELMPGWMRTAAKFNPMEWAVEAGRAALTDHPDWGAVGTRLLALTGFALACGLVSVRAFRAYQRAT